MNIQEFCDLYSVSPRDRVAAGKFFSSRGINEATEEEWISNFENAQFALGRSGKPQMKDLIMKTLEQLLEIARQYPETEWSDLATNKAKMAKYLSNK